MVYIHICENLMALLVGEGHKCSRNIYETPKGRILLPWEREVWIFRKRSTHLVNSIQLHKFLEVVSINKILSENI